MSRRRRVALLLGLAVVLGALAASDVGRREAALRAQLGPPVDVVVARRALAAGRRVTLADLAVRRLPGRYAPAGATGVPEAVIGGRLAVSVPAGAAVAPGLLHVAAGAGHAVRRGERVAQVVASADPAAVVPGARVDVLVTHDRGDGGDGGTRLALEDVEVLAAGPAPESAAGARDLPGAHVQALLRVTVRQAVYLAAAQAFARDIRLLARAPGDSGRTGAVAVGEGL